jgi:colanic acid/amylovoran biosynthesis protein
LEDCAGSCLIIEEPLPPDLLKAVYGRLDLLIGTRMHSNIFAMSQGVPVLAIGYQQKTMGIMQMVSLDEWVIDIQQISAEVLIQKLAALWERRPAVRDFLLSRTSELARQVDQAGQLIAADYAELQKGSADG